MVRLSGAALTTRPPDNRLSASPLLTPPPWRCLLNWFNLSLVGWIPWSALIGIDDLAYDIAQTGSTPELAALWTRFNSDAVMLTYLLIYVVGHLFSTVLIAIMLGRLRMTVDGVHRRLHYAVR